jgi:hypothetical protein
MKFFTKSILVAFTISMALTVQAQTSSYGNCNYNKQTVADITCYGTATIIDSTVTGTINVFGPLTMTNVTANDVIVKGPLTMTYASVNDIEVKGPLNVNSSTVKGLASVDGPVEATRSTFEKDVFSASNFVMLSSSQVVGKVTEKSSDEKAILKMTDKSIISGNVEFSGQTGQVILDSQSKVMGTVINGTK